MLKWVWWAERPLFEEQLACWTNPADPFRKATISHFQDMSIKSSFPNKAAHAQALQLSWKCTIKWKLCKWESCRMPNPSTYFLNRVSLTAEMQVHLYFSPLPQNKPNTWLLLMWFIHVKPWDTDEVQKSERDKYWIIMCPCHYDRIT